MTWSTRRLADLAETTVKTVRHYHSIGLLEQPARAANGYKQYGTRHLVRLLQIRRLRDLGMSLAEIGEAIDADEGFLDAVRALDDQLAVSIERQRAMRAELADLLVHRTGPDVPAGFESVADGLTSADRAMITVSALLFDEQGMQDMRDIAAEHREADDAFNALPGNADSEEIRAVTAQLAPILRSIHAQYPDTRHPPRPAAGRSRESQQALTQALIDLYNPAQVEVLRQAYLLVQEEPGSECPGYEAPQSGS